MSDLSLNEIDRLRYALAKQVKSIHERGAVFETNYGRLELDAADSVKVAALVKKLLEKKLHRVAQS